MALPLGGILGRLLHKISGRFELFLQLLNLSRLLCQSGINFRRAGIEFLILVGRLLRPTGLVTRTTAGRIRNITTAALMALSGVA